MFLKSFFIESARCSFQHVPILKKIRFISVIEKCTSVDIWHAATTRDPAPNNKHLQGRCG